MNEQVQCTCGIFFVAPIANDPAYIAHAVNGAHATALLVEVCGPCFVGFCKGCDGTRRSEVQRWRCRCLHDHPLTFNEPSESENEMRRLWSEWLESGRNSSVSIGIEKVKSDEGETI